MACGCKGTCGCLGSYGPAPALAFAGWRLRVPGNPSGGQYHGYLGNNPSPFDFANPGTHDGRVYRAPGETPPKANPNGPTNVVRVRHSRRQAGYAVSPGAYRALGAVAVPISNVRYPDPIAIQPPPGMRRWPVAPVGPQPIVPSPITPIAPTPVAQTPQPPPPFSPSPSPTTWNRGKPCPRGMFQDPAGNCSPRSGVCPSGAAIDASGNCTTDERNPYSLYLPQQQQSSPVVSAPTSATPSAGQGACVTGQYDASGNCISAAPTVACASGEYDSNGNCIVASTPTVAATPTASWLTDPTQELISGIPNWGVLAGAGLALMLLMRGRR